MNNQNNNNLVNVYALESIINFYTKTDEAFKTCFSFNLNTPYTSNPFDLFLAKFQTQALYSNIEKEVVAKFNTIYYENRFIFQQIINKVNLVNDLLNKDNYTNEINTINTQNQTNNQKQALNNQQTQRTQTNSNDITSDDNSSSEELSATNLNAFNANIKQQSFNVSDLTTANIQSLEQSNSLTLNNNNVTLSKNTAKAILEILNLDVVNFRDQFLNKFAVMFTPIKTNTPQALLIKYPKYLQIEDFKKYKKTIAELIQNNTNEIKRNFSADNDTIAFIRGVRSLVNEKLQKQQEAINLLESLNVKTSLKISELNNQFFNQQEKLTTTYDMLNKQNKSINNQISQINTIINNHNQTLEDHTAKINLLNPTLLQITALEKTTQTLSNQNSELLSEITKLKNEAIKLQSNITTLQQQNVNQQNNINQVLNLSNQINELDKKIQSKLSLESFYNFQEQAYKAPLEYLENQLKRFEEWGTGGHSVIVDKTAKEQATDAIQVLVYVLTSTINKAKLNLNSINDINNNLTILRNNIDQLNNSINTINSQISTLSNNQNKPVVKYAFDWFTLSQANYLYKNTYTWGFVNPEKDAVIRRVIEVVNLETNKTIRPEYNPEQSGWGVGNWLTFEQNFNSYWAPEVNEMFQRSWFSGHDDKFKKLSADNMDIRLGFYNYGGNNFNQAYIYAVTKSPNRYKMRLVIYYVKG